MPHTPEIRASHQSPGPAALRRIFHIHSRLADGGQLSAATLAKELEISVRTIKRDIETLRHEHGAEILWDPVAGAYCCTRPSEHLPLLRISADEAIAVALAGRTFAAWGGSPLGRALESALAKVAQVVGNAVSLPADAVADCIFQSDDTSGTDATRRHFALLLEAIRRRSAVRIIYRKPGITSASERMIHPLHLAYLDHDWMLVAFDPAKNALRNFLLTRIEELHHTGRGFLPPLDFDPKQHLAGAFGRHAGGLLREVHIRFDVYAAPFIRERRWHPSQAIRDSAHGGIVVTLQINHLLDVQRWVLSWGSHAEVLAPKELLDSVALEVAGMSQYYTTGVPIPSAAGHPMAHPRDTLASRHQTTVNSLDEFGQP